MGRDDWIDELLEDEVVWVSRDGRSYRMAEIGDNHLCNIILFLERQADAAESCGFTAEHAEDAAEAAASLLRARAEDFRGEAAARGLRI